MHFIVHILAWEPITNERLTKIMAPFNEAQVFKDVDDNTESWMPVPRPQFTWDYYTPVNENVHHKLEDCFALIAPDGYCMARRWWDGMKWINRSNEFDNFCRQNIHKWAGKAYMVEVDCHA